MDKLTIHLGHPKTGSSFIQTFLALNIDLLNEFGINYPFKGNLPNAKKGYMVNGNGGELISKDGKIKLKISETKNILISDEILFYRLLKLNNIDSYLNTFSKDIKIIIYTRNPFELLASEWGQLIKRHNYVNDLNTFLIQYPNKIYETLQKWIELSIKYNFKLKIRNYSYIKKNLIKVFLEDIFDKEIDINKFQIPPLKRINRSLSLSEYELLRVFNIRQPKEKISDILINLAPEIKTSKIRISKEAYERTILKYSDKINIINNHLSVDNQIKIESSKEVCIQDTELNHAFLNKRQIEIISNYLNNSYFKDENLYHTNDIKVLFKISQKILLNKKSLNNHDSFELIKIALKINPNGPILMNQFKRIQNLLKKANFSKNIIN